MKLETSFSTHKMTSSISLWNKMLSWGILTKPNSLLLRAAHSCYMEKVEKIETLSLIMASKSFFFPSLKKKKKTNKKS